MNLEVGPSRDERIDTPVEAAAERQGITLLSDEPEGDCWLGATDVGSGWYIRPYYFDEEDSELRLTIGSGEVYTTEQITRLPPVADLLESATVALEQLDYVLEGWSEFRKSRFSWSADKLRAAIAKAQGE